MGNVLVGAGDDSGVRILLAVAAAALLAGCGAGGAGPHPVTRSTFGPGMYKVGSEIQPGDYTSPGPTPPAKTCYWGRLDNVSTSAHLAGSGAAIGPTTLTVRPSDEYVKIDGCTFTKV